MPAIPFAEVDGDFKSCFVSGGKKRNCPLRKKCEILVEKVLQESKSFMKIKKYEYSSGVSTKSSYPSHPLVRRQHPLRLNFFIFQTTASEILTYCCVENIIKNLLGSYPALFNIVERIGTEERWETRQEKGKVRRYFA